MKMNFRGGLERNGYRSCHILPPPGARHFKTLPLFTIYLSVSWYYLQFRFQRRKWGSEMMSNCPGSHTDRAALEPSFLWPETQDHTATPLHAAEGLMLRPLWFEGGAGLPAYVWAAGLARDPRSPTGYRVQLPPSLQSPRTAHEERRCTVEKLSVCKQPSLSQR